MSETGAPYGETAQQAERDYRNNSQQLLIEVVDALTLRPFEPVPLVDIVDRAGESRDAVFRACKNLELAGWAEQTGGRGWRLTPHLTGISERLRVALSDLHRTYLQPEGGGPP